LKEMNPILITVAVAVALVGVLTNIALWQNKQIKDVTDLEGRWKLVDMEAFLNLVDPAEERYLRRNLPASQFRSLQRARVRVMWEYLGRLSFNAKLMMQAAQIVQHHSSGEQLQEATHLVASATRFRLLIFAADAYLAVRFLLPETSDPIRQLVGRYDALTQMFTQTCGQRLAAASVAS
jgi:hypothetical protein